MNDRARGATSPTFVLVRFGERPRLIRRLVGLTIVVALLLLSWNRLAAAALLVVVPLLLLIRYQRRALVLVRPSGPIVVKGWWSDASVSPQEITSVQWQRRGDVAFLRIVIGDAFVNCQSVAIPTGGRLRPQDRNWPAKVDALVDALADVGVDPLALDPLVVVDR